MPYSPSKKTCVLPSRFRASTLNQTPGSFANMCSNSDDEEKVQGARYKQSGKTKYPATGLTFLMGAAQTPKKTYVITSEDTFSSKLPRPKFEITLDETIKAQPPEVLSTPKRGSTSFYFSKENFSPNSQKHLKTPEKGIASTPNKGPATSSVFSPGGSQYANQGLIHIVKDGKTIDVGTFIEAKYSSPDNQFSIPGYTQQAYDALSTHFKQLVALDALPASVVINKAQIQEIREEGKKRCPRNKTVMGNCSAKEVFEKAFGVKCTTDLQWLHRKAAYLVGRYDDEAQRSFAQNPHNFILGTTEANAFMTLPELTIEALLNDKALGIDAVTLTETITWHPNFKDLIAEKITYTLAANNSSITFEINPWSLNKVPANLEALLQHIIKDALKKSDAPLTPQKRKAEAPVTPLYNNSKKQYAHQSVKDKPDPQGAPTAQPTGKKKPLKRILSFS